MSNLSLNKTYADFLAEIKTQIKSNQAKAAIAANSSLIAMYWSIGKIIASKQNEYSWGSNIIEQLAADLKSEFPGIAGISRANLFFIRRFYLFHSDEKVQQAVRLLPEGESSVQQAVALNEVNLSLHQLLFQVPWGLQQNNRRQRVYIHRSSARRIENRYSDGEGV